MMTMMINWGWEVDGTGLVSFTNSSTVFACQWWRIFLFYCQRLVSFIARDGPRRGGATGRLQIWLPLKFTFFKHFWPETGLVKLFEGAFTNCRFSFSHGNLILLKHHVSDYFSEVLAPLTVWHPGQLWLTGCIITTFLFCQYFFNFSLNQNFQEDLFAGNSARNPNPALRGHWKVQRNAVWRKASCASGGTNRKKGLLSVNLQLQGKQCTGLHKPSHKFYINGCASPVSPINAFCMTLYDKQRRVQVVCDGGTE